MVATKHFELRTPMTPHVAFELWEKGKTKLLKKRRIELKDLYAKIKNKGETDFAKAAAKFKIRFEEKKDSASTQELVEFVTSQKQSLEEILNQKVPQSAQTEFSRLKQFQHQANPPELKIESEILKERYGIAAKRIWNNKKPELERRYGVTLDSREDFAVMRGLFNVLDELSPLTEPLKRDFKRLQGMTQLAQKEPKSGYEEMAELWENYNVLNQIGSLAGQIHSTFEILSDPTYMFLDIYDPKILDEVDRQVFDEDDEVNQGSLEMTQTGWFAGTDFGLGLYVDHFDKYGEELIQVPRKVHLGEFSFKDALALTSPRFNKYAKVLKKRGPKTTARVVPRELEPFINQRLKEGFENRTKEDPEVTQYLKWISKQLVEILNSWEKTSWESFGQASLEREGSDLIYHYDLLKTGDRLAGNNHVRDIQNLRDLVKSTVDDKILEPHEIIRPRAIREFEARQLSLPGNGIETRALSHVKTDRPLLEGPRNLITNGKNPKQEPSKGRHTIPELEKEGLEIIYSGDRIYILRDYTNGKETYSVSNQPVSDVKKGDELLDSKEGQFLLRRIKPCKIVSNSVQSNATDTITLSQFTAITNIDTDTFKDEYWRDFLGIAFSYWSVFESKEDTTKNMSRLEELTEFDPKNTYIRRGEGWQKTQIQTFEHEGKFAFDISTRRPYANTEITEFVHLFTQYLRDCGIDYSTGVPPDTKGTGHFASEKLRRRNLFYDHFDTVHQALKGKQQLAPLFFAAESPHYSFAPKFEKCEHCHETIVSGHVSTKGRRREQGFNAKSLHIIANHPREYEDDGHEFEGIIETLKVAEGYEPLFTIYPELQEKLRGLNSFYALYEEFYRGYSDLNCQQLLGVPGNVSPDEVQEIPEFAKLQEEDELLHKEFERFRLIRKGLVNRLNKQASKKENLFIEMTDSEKDYFWITQAMVHRIYENIIPELLLEQPESRALTQFVPNPISIDSRLMRIREDPYQS